MGNNYTLRSGEKKSQQTRQRRSSWRERRKSQRLQITETKRGEKFKKEKAANCVKKYEEEIKKTETWMCCLVSPY